MGHSVVKINATPLMRKGDIEAARRLMEHTIPEDLPLFDEVVVVKNYASIALFIDGAFRQLARNPNPEVKNADLVSAKRLRDQIVRVSDLGI